MKGRGDWQGRCQFRPGKSFWILRSHRTSSAKRGALTGDLRKVAGAGSFDSSGRQTNALIELSGD